MKTVIINAVVSIVCSLCAGGGLFYWLSKRAEKAIADRQSTCNENIADAAADVQAAHLLLQQQKLHEKADSEAVREWQDLYEEMRETANTQRDRVEELEKELQGLRREIQVLRDEVLTYRTVDTYISNLEHYQDTLLETIRPLVATEVFESLLSRAPIRQSVNTVS